LIRDSKSEETDHVYSMSLFFNSNVHHLKILRRNVSDKMEFSIGESKSMVFANINKMVEHFKKEPLCLQAKGSTKIKEHPEILEQKKRRIE